MKSSWLGSTTSSRPANTSWLVHPHNTPSKCRPGTKLVRRQIPIVRLKKRTIQILLHRISTINQSKLTTSHSFWNNVALRFRYPVSFQSLPSRSVPFCHLPAQQPELLLTKTKKSKRSGKSGSVPFFNLFTEMPFLSPL